MNFWKRLFGAKDTSSSLSVPASSAEHDSEAGETMLPLDRVLGTLLETWDQRYTFKLDRQKRELALNVASFELLATETGNGKIQLAFEEAGKKHRVECSVEEAPTIIEALLFPES